MNYKNSKWPSGWWLAPALVLSLVMIGVLSINFPRFMLGAGLVGLTLAVVGAGHDLMTHTFEEDSE